MRVADEFTPEEVRAATGTKPGDNGPLHMPTLMTWARIVAERREEARVIFGPCLHGGTCGTWSAGECGVCEASRLWLEGKYGDKWWMELKTATAETKGFRSNGLAARSTTPNSTVEYPYPRLSTPAGRRTLLSF